VLDAQLHDVAHPEPEAGFAIAKIVAPHPTEALVKTQR
jgi:hypothetical protein